jgi:hypothetical protein
VPLVPMMPIVRVPKVHLPAPLPPLHDRSA